MLSLYDRLYRTARRSDVPALQVYNFCRRLERELEPHWSVLDPKAAEGLVVDLYDPGLTVSENLSNVLGALGLYSRGGWSGDYEAWNYGWGIESYERKLKVLRRHCEAVGRDPGEMALTYNSDIIVTETKRELKSSSLGGGRGRAGSWARGLRLTWRSTGTSTYSTVRRGR